MRGDKIKMQERIGLCRIHKINAFISIGGSWPILIKEVFRLSIEQMCQAAPIEPEVEIYVHI